MFAHVPQSLPWCDQRRHIILSNFSRKTLVALVCAAFESWTDALPIGSGRFGAMIFGGVEAERIQLNEDTLWSGAPKDWNNPEALKNLPEVRRLVLEQRDYAAASTLTKKLQGPYNQSYEPIGNVHLKFAHHSPVNYRRELDLDTAIATVSYQQDGVDYLREYFSSTPDQIMQSG